MGEWGCGFLFGAVVVVVVVQMRVGCGRLGCSVCNQMHDEICRRCIVIILLIDNYCSSSPKHGYHPLVADDDHPFPTYTPCDLPGCKGDFRDSNLYMSEQGPERVVDKVFLSLL